VEGLEDKVGPPVSTGTAGVATKTPPLPRSRIQFQQAHRKQRNRANRKDRSSRDQLKRSNLKHCNGNPEPSPTPIANADSFGSTQNEPTGTSQRGALRAAGSRLRSSIRITGRVLDSNANGLSNVVVVLISPSGSVLASTTDKDGYYSFTVTPSQNLSESPSKDGYTFTPVDKAFAGLIDDQKGIDFIAKSP
jgi:hypothetical protein